MRNVAVQSPPSRWRRFWRTAFLMVEAMETTEGELLEREVNARLSRLEERLEKLEANSSDCAKDAGGT